MARLPALAFVPSGPRSFPRNFASSITMGLKKLRSLGV